MKLNAIRSADLSCDGKVAAVGLTLIREFFPIQQSESDLATRVRLELLAEIVAEVGEAKFIAAVKQTLKISRNRYECTVLRIRECCGLPWTPPLSPASAAWAFATKVFTEHARTNAEGQYVLEPRYTRSEGKVTITPPPHIPASVKRAIDAMGGWGALADRSVWGYRMRDFRDLYAEGDAQPAQGRG